MPSGAELEQQIRLHTFIYILFEGVLIRFQYVRCDEIRESHEYVIHVHGVFSYNFYSSASGNLIFAFTTFVSLTRLVDLVRTFRILVLWAFLSFHCHL